MDCGSQTDHASQHASRNPSRAAGSVHAEFPARYSASVPSSRLLGGNAVAGYRSPRWLRHADLVGYHLPCSAACQDEHALMISNERLAMPNTNEPNA